MDNTYLYLDWLLLVIMFLSFCQQLFSTKFNFYGIASIISLAIYIALHSYNTELNIFVLLLFLGAIILIVLEMFLPGGILGVVGVITLVAAIIFINQKTTEITFILVVSVVLFAILFLVNRKIFNKKLLLLNRLVLNDSITTEEGYVAKESQNNLVGKVLSAYTDLRPAGTAILNEEKFDVVTEGDFISKGSSIEVIKTEGMRIVVRKK